MQTRYRVCSQCRTKRRYAVTTASLSTFVNRQTWRCSQGHSFTRDVPTLDGITAMMKEIYSAKALMWAGMENTLYATLRRRT